MKRVMIAGMISMLALAPNVHAGTVLEMINRDLTNKEETIATTYAQDGRMRVNSGSVQDGYVVFRDDTLFTFDPKEKTYMAMDRAAMKKLADQLNPALQMLQQQMANMSPEQRAQMERMLGSKLPGTEKPPVEEVRKTARTDTVAGYSCKYSEVLQDGVVSREACVVPPASLKGSQELFDVAVKVSALVKDMMASIDSPLIKNMVNKEMANFEQLGGMPLLIRTFDEGKAIHEGTMKSIRTEALAASMFDIPAGYTKRDLPSIAR